MGRRKLVAVYGTLRVGYENYDRYLRGLTPVRALFVEVPFRMYANDEYPMLVPADDGARHRIWVEIFDVDDVKLKELDALEAPYGYWREPVFVEELGRDVEIYLHPAPAPEGFTEIASGKWTG